LLHSSGVLSPKEKDVKIQVEGESKTAPMSVTKGEMIKDIMKAPTELLGSINSKFS
jgi:hypothetical protein